MYQSQSLADRSPLIVWLVIGQRFLDHATHVKESHMNMYIGNLAYNVTEEDLTTAFSEFGTVESVNIIKDRFSGQSKGFGFVDMPDNSEADKAIKALNGIDIKGRDIKVNQANQKPKGKKNSRRPRY
jgi:RNA recognition motif-containing protein